MQRISYRNYICILKWIKFDFRRLGSIGTDPGFQIKQYNDKKQYKKAVDLFETLNEDQKSSPIVINQTLRSYIELSNFQKAKDLHQKLSSYLLNNQYIRAALIRLYSELNNCRFFYFFKVIQSEFQ